MPYSEKARYDHYQQKSSLLFKNFYNVPFSPEHYKGIKLHYKGERFKRWFYVGTPARAIVGNLKISGKIAIQSVLIPRDVKAPQRNVAAMRIKATPFDTQYKTEARKKLKERDIEVMHKLPRDVTRMLKDLAMKSPVEYVAGLDLEPSNTGTKLQRMVLIRGKEFEADSDEIFDFEMLFHNHVPTGSWHGGSEYVNFIPSPDDFMNVTLNKPHVISFKDGKTKRPRFILLRSIRENTPNEAFFERQMQSLAWEINKQFNIHDNPGRFTREYRKRLNELGFDFKYVDPSKVFIIYKNKS